MSFDFQRRGRSFSQCSLDDIFRKCRENILDEYQHAWEVSSYKDCESVIRSCEQKLIKLDKKTLVDYLQQFVRKPSQSWRFGLFIKLTENKYTSCTCLLHLLHVFCIPGQEEKIKTVKVELNEVMHTMTEKERFDIFERYLSQRLKVKSSLTEIDLLTDQIDPHNEFLLKLCYWDIFCAIRTDEGCKTFLQQNVDYLLSNIERKVRSILSKFLMNKKTALISCTMLLCLLNWNICDTQNPVILQNKEAQASSSVALVDDTSVNYSCTAHRVSNKLQIVWSTLSKDDVSTVFNNYINKMSAMKTDLTEDDFCTDKIGPYFEFISKLCYWDYLCIEKNYKRCKGFLLRNADFLVTQIEEVVHGNKTKTKHISCKILLCLLNWNICIQKTTLTQSIIQNIEIPCSIQTEEYTTKKSCTMYKVRCLLQNLLSTLIGHDTSEIFAGYIETMYALKSEITPGGLCIGETESRHEFQLKLCYWKSICRRKDYGAYKKIIHLYPEVLVSHIEEVVVGQHETRNKISSCKTLLCILNWNICPQKTSTPLNFHECSFTSEVNKTTKCPYTADKVRSLLQKLLSTLSEDEIISAFNQYLEQMNTMKSEIKEDDFCTGKIEPFHEFMLKLCYFEKLRDTIDDFEPYREFLRNNADFLVTQIEEVVHGNKTKTKHISCKILLYLLNWNICIQKTTSIQSGIQKSEIQQSCTVYNVRCILQNLLSTLADHDISQVFNNYLDQMHAMKSEITPDGMCIGETDSCHEFKLKLCYWKTICREREYETYKKFIQLYPEFLVSHMEDVVQKNEKWKTFSPCTTLLCILNWNVYYQKTSTPLNFQDCSFTSEVHNTTKCQYTADKVRSLLQKLLLILSEDEIHTTFNDYLEQMYAMKSEITEDDFCTGKIEPYLEFQLKLCYCARKWSKPQVEFITKNTKFFLSMVEEVNKRNQLRMKFKMCQVLNIIMDAKIIHSLIDNCENDAVEVLMRLENNDDKNAENAYQMVSCILILKTKLDNFIEHKKIPKQSQDHIKEFLLSLLADMLSLLSTKHINEAFSLHVEKSCLSNPNVMLELAKTFLDISINHKISHEKKTIIGSKIQQTLITCDTGKKTLLPTTDLTDSTGGKLDHKRIINICINVVKTKTESKHINIPMYEGFFCTEKKAIENEVEMEKRSQEIETLVLLMLLLITITSTGHHKSAKLKKYLTLKYEYATASLHLLWCSGDIEVHPGPSLSKKSLTHDSSIERRWIQNLSPKILILLPEHEQSKYKPTKKLRNDMENREHFKTLLKTCLEEKVHVPKMYLAELNAWETKKYKLLNKLFVYRCEIETIIASLKDFLTSGGRTNDLTACNVSYATELKTNEIAVVLGKDQIPKDKSQLMAYIPGKIANILIKCAHGKDPDAKHDGLWDLFLKNWPTDIILFDPNNREKHSKKHPGQKLIPDQELVDILLKLPQVTIPQKYKEIVDAFRTMRKSQKDKSINKQHKAELCSTFKRITSLEKLDYALKNLWESGIFTEEVHNNLNKWWTGAVDTPDDQNVSQVNIIEVRKSRRPHILINISTKSITLTVEQTDANSSHVSYDFPFSDELVPLKTMATTVHQTTIQKPSSDSYQMVTAKKYTVSSKQDACPADNQTYSIIISPLDLNPNSQAILESDIKHQQNISTQETALCSTIDFDQLTSSTKQTSQLSKTIAIPNQSTTNSDDTSSATKDSQSLHFHTQVSPVSDIGSSDSISSVNSKSGNDDRDQTDISNGGKVISTDSDYSSDSSNNCVSKTNIQKRKFTEEDRNGMKKRKIPSQEDKKPIETNHRQMDCLMDNTASFDKNREILPDWLLDIDLDSYDIDNQTFKVDQNALDNEDTELVKFLQDMINCESEKNVTNKNI